MEWISIKDRLPEESDEGIIFYDGDEVLHGWYMKKYPSWDHDGQVSYKEDGICLNETEGSYIPLKDVTHWIPMPNPPKE